MTHRCPYCFTDTESRQGLHSHMMQKKTCRQSMEEDAYISESASETATANEHNTDSPTQHANNSGLEEDDNLPSDNEMLFEVPFPSHSEGPVTGVQVATAASPQLPSSPNPLATVEDADDDNNNPDADDNNETRWIEEFPYPAGVPIGEGVSCFEKWRRNQEKNKEPAWSPFESREEWELAQWLITSNISQRKIDALLKLKLVSFTKTS